MAKQKSFIKIEGTIGDLTFYKSKDGYYVRQKGGVDGNKIATDPRFERTRENNAEFGHAGEAGKMVRRAFRSITLGRSDRYMIARLTRQMLKIVQMDQGPRGQRKIDGGDLKTLRGFEFNNDGHLSTTFYGFYDVEINRSSGEVTVDIEPFVPRELLIAPEGTTHFKIVSAAAVVDFENEDFLIAKSQTDFMPWDNEETTPINQINALPENIEWALFVALGFDFYQEVSGGYYPLKNGSFNPLSLVEVENAV